MSDSPKCPLCGEGMDDEQKPTCVLKQKRAAEDPTIPPEGPIMLSKDPISPPEGLSCSQRTLPTIQRAYHAFRGPYQPFRGHIMLSVDLTSPPEGPIMVLEDPTSPAEGPIMLSEDPSIPLEFRG